MEQVGGTPCVNSDIEEAVVSRELLFEQVAALLDRYNTNSIVLAGSTNLNADLNIDSVAAMDVIMEIEDKFEIDIPINFISDVETVDDLVDLVQKRTGGG